MQITPNSFIDFVYGFKSFVPNNLDDLVEYFPYFHRNIKTRKFTIDHHIYSIATCHQIKFDAAIIISSKFYGVGGDFETKPYSAAYINLEKTFLLIIGMGKDTFIGSSIIKFIRNSPEKDFINLSGSKFKCIHNNICVSYEQDEYDNYYFFIASDVSLITSDVLFNFGRDICNYVE
jgi:hypothetical protein